MLGNAAMIAVLLAPTANIARHDDHRIGANGVRWSIVTPWSPSRSDSSVRLAALAAARAAGAPWTSPASSIQTTSSFGGTARTAPNSCPRWGNAPAGVASPMAGNDWPAQQLGNVVLAW